MIAPLTIGSLGPPRNPPCHSCTAEWPPGQPDWLLARLAGGTLQHDVVLLRCSRGSVRSVRRVLRMAVTRSAVCEIAGQLVGGSDADAPVWPEVHYPIRQHRRSVFRQDHSCEYRSRLDFRLRRRTSLWHSSISERAGIFRQKRCR